MIEKTKEVLSVDEVDCDILSDRLQTIIVPAHNQLRFILKGDTAVDIEWRHRSRKESWTPEMKQTAREKTLKRQAERRTNERKA